MQESAVPTTKEEEESAKSTKLLRTLAEDLGKVSNSLDAVEARAKEIQQLSEEELRILGGEQPRAPFSSASLSESQVMTVADLKPEYPASESLTLSTIMHEEVNPETAPVSDDVSGNRTVKERPEDIVAELRAGGFAFDFQTQPGAVRVLNRKEGMPDKLFQELKAQGSAVSRILLDEHAGDIIARLRNDEARFDFEENPEKPAIYPGNASAPLREEAKVHMASIRRVLLANKAEYAFPKPPILAWKNGSFWRVGSIGSIPSEQAKQGHDILTSLRAVGADLVPDEKGGFLYLTEGDQSVPQALREQVKTHGYSVAVVLHAELAERKASKSAPLQTWQTSDVAQKPQMPTASEQEALEKSLEAQMQWGQQEYRKNLADAIEDDKNSAKAAARARRLALRSLGGDATSSLLTHQQLREGVSPGDDKVVPASPTPSAVAPQDAARKGQKFNQLYDVSSDQSPKSEYVAGPLTDEPPWLVLERSFWSKPTIAQIERDVLESVASHEPSRRQLEASLFTTDPNENRPTPMSPPPWREDTGDALSGVSGLAPDSVNPWGSAYTQMLAQGRRPTVTVGPAGSSRSSPASSGAATAIRAPKVAAQHTTPQVQEGSSSLQPQEGIVASDRGKVSAASSRSYSPDPGKGVSSVNPGR